MFRTAIFLSVLFTIIVKGNSLDCYVCYDCDQVNDEYVATCEDLDSNSTTSTTSTTPTSYTTESSTNTTTPTVASTESTTTTESNTTSTTIPTTNSTNSTTSTTTSTTTTTTEGSVFMDRAERANTTFECVKGKITVNNTQVTIRGCMLNRGNDSCEAFGLSSCSFCSKDKCNGSGTIQASVILLVASFFTYLFKE